MTLEPLLNAGSLTQLHAFAGMTAVALGVIQLAAPKGTVPHRALGWAWVALMLLMLASTFQIHDVLWWGPFSPKICYLPSKSMPWITRCVVIQLLTIGFLLSLPYAVLHARLRNLDHHRRAMITLLIGVLVIAGAFTLDTDRIMHAVLFGP